MRMLPIVLLASGLATNVFAADVTDPVKQVMDMTKFNWESVDQEWKYIFDKDPLSKLYSKRFQDAYKEASKHPAYDTENNQPGDPFGYDVITNSQDGCPLQNIKITPAAPQNGVTEVKVSFKMWTCIDDAQIKDGISEVSFDIITENGKTVIDDIHRIGDGEKDSLLAEMQAIAKGQ